MSIVEFNEEDIKGVECKHVVYTKGIPSDYGAIPDDHVLIKEVVHLKDGRLIPRLKQKINFQRPFWITKEGFQNHEEKKEWEDLDKLKIFHTTQAGLDKAIKRALNINAPVFGLKRICRNPFVYGADISSTALIKRFYQDKYPDCKSMNRVAVLDIETDVNLPESDPRSGEPILVSITFKDKAILAATKYYADGIDNFEEKMQAHFKKRMEDLGDDALNRNIKLEVVVEKNPLEAIKVVMGKAHEWMPDFLAVWNVNFDIPKILRAIEQYGGDPGDIFSDPSVPKEFRKIWWKEGPAKKVTANGREEALHWVDRWHTLFCPASFYVIDQACVFRKLRVAKGREPSYALDAILKKYTDTAKLKNEKADTMTGLEWHQYMQKEEKLEYAVYNIWDCVSCEILDEQPKVGDLRSSMSIQCGHSDYDKFPSQPRRTVDDLHYQCLKLGKVIATTSDQMKTDFDKMTVSIRDWIITLPAHMVSDNGLKIIKEMPELTTLIYTSVYDLDVTAAYPSGEDVLNCSKATTLAEVIKIKGVSEQTQRNAGLNLSAGTTNATEILCSVCKAPTFEMLLKDFEENELTTTSV